MGKYRNHTNRPLIIGLSAGGLALIIIEAIHIIHSFQVVNDLRQQQEVVDDAHAYIVITDSTGKKDTQRLTDYVKKMKEEKDTSVKTEILFPNSIDTSVHQ